MSKYLFIATNEWLWGGSEILWSQTAERLAQDGAEVRVSIYPAPGKPREPMDRLRAAGVKVIYRRPLSLLARLARKVFPLPEYTNQHVRSVGRGVDLVVICQSSFPEVFPWMEAVRTAGFKYTLIVQGVDTSLWPDDDRAERLASGFEKADAAFFVSQATLDLCRRQMSTPLRRGRVVRNPFNVRYDARPPWPTDLSESLSLACIGRLEFATKGQDMLLEVLALPHWRERNIRVTIVGSGPQERGLRRRAAELKLKNVEFTGHQSDVESIWTKHHALILPSRQEGMPLVVVEAMLCGRACIATKVGGNAELICDGKNGFLAKAATVEFIDEALNRAWEDRGHLRQMGERAAAAIRQAVPPDPVGEFARELTALAERKSPVSTNDEAA